MTYRFVGNSKVCEAEAKDKNILNAKIRSCRRRQLKEKTIFLELKEPKGAVSIFKKGYIFIWCAFSPQYTERIEGLFLKRKSKLRSACSH